MESFDKATKTGICTECGPVDVRVKTTNGGATYIGRCKNAERQYKNPYKRSKKDYCERCGFRAEHPCQLDVDHIDGNHNNNDPLNLQTLCANCHRLKTILSEDHLSHP